MLAASIRASRVSIARIAGQVAVKRTFITPTAARSADLVQELYLKELKAYKPTPIKASDAEGNVQKFVIPQAPKSPEEGDIAAQLKAYEASAVEVEGQAAAGETVIVEDWFEDEPVEEAKH